MLDFIIKTWERFDNFMADILTEEIWDAILLFWTFVAIITLCIAVLWYTFRFIMWLNDYIALFIVATALTLIIRAFLRQHNRKNR